MIIADPGKAYFNALAGYSQLADNMQERQRRNALDDFWAEHGEGVASGNINSLQELAKLDGKAAFDLRRQMSAESRARAADARAVESHNLGMRLDQAQLDAITARTKREAEKWAEGKDAAEIERTMAEHNRVLAALSTAQTPEEWNAIAQQNDAEELMDKFDQSEALFAEHLGLKAALERSMGPKPLSEEGKRNFDAQNGFVDLDLPQVDFETEQKFRKEFLGIPQVKAFSEQAQAFGRIESSATNPSPAGDLALIFNFMKVLDPGSVVRESEFATAESAAAWLQQSEEAGMTVPLPVARSIRKLATGQRLSPEQRDDFVNRGRSLYADAERGFMRIKEQYEDKARAYNLDPQRSLTDFRRPPSQPAPLPAFQEAPQQPSQTPQITFQNEDQRRVFERYSQPSE